MGITRSKVISQTVAAHLMLSQDEMQKRPAVFFRFRCRARRFSFLLSCSFVVAVVLYAMFNGDGFRGCSCFLVCSPVSMCGVLCYVSCVLCAMFRCDRGAPPLMAQLPKVPFSPSHCFGFISRLPACTRNMNKDTKNEQATYPISTSHLLQSY